MGANPFRKKRALSLQHKRELAKRLPRGRQDFAE
jgi:hypothetical protein